MSTQPCHYDRTIGYRVTADHHTDDCPTHTGGTCPSRHGACQPCPHPHCSTCGYRHITDPTAHPRTCPECIGQTRRDLDDIRWLCRHLRWQAARAGHDGRLAAAAPIPGGDAMVMLRAGADGDDLIWSPTLNDDHRPSDPVPPLLPLAGWDLQVRRWLGHQPPARPTVTGLTHYLADHLARFAQATDGPDWYAFTRDIAALRRQLEGVLHDEKDPERGITCFECDDQLVRRFGDPKPCRHATPGRQRLGQVEREIQAAQAWLTVVESYPELGPPTYAEQRAAARIPTSAQQSAAREPCEACAASRAGQGGIIDPSVGQSWECLGCRKQYTPAEYWAAVRSTLLQAGPGRDGWTYVSMAAEAASTLAGMLVPPGTVRRWVDRNQVTACCRWTPGVRRGQVLVFWDSVRDRVLVALERAERAAAERRRLESEWSGWSAAVDAGEGEEEAGARLGIHPQRVRRFSLLRAEGAEEISA